VQIWLMIAFNYSYGPSKSVDLLHGGDMVVWWGHLGLRGGVFALLASLGGLLLLVPLGYARAPRALRLLAVATVPAAVVLCYVQQPDRALWNFQYVMIPLAVIALESLSDFWCWAFVVCAGLVNLRTAAQFPFAPNARYALLAALAIAAAALVAAWKRPMPVAAPIDAHAS
jgi:hypothetical protein